MTQMRMVLTLQMSMKKQELKKNRDTLPLNLETWSVGVLEKMSPGLRKKRLAHLSVLYTHVQNVHVL